MEEEELLKPEPKPEPKPAKSAKPASSGFGLSWDFGAPSGGNSLFGGDSDIMAMLSKMEKKDAPKSKPKATVVEAPADVKSSSSTPKIAPGIPITDPQRSQFPEFFLDVGSCFDCQ